MAVVPLANTGVSCADGVSELIPANPVGAADFFDDAPNHGNVK